MVVKGKVVRIETYGAFVDIGAERPGLVSVSELTRGYVKTPNEVVKEGDEVEAKVLDVDRRKRQIRLSMKAILPELAEEEKPEREERKERSGGKRRGKKQQEEVYEMEAEPVSQRTRDDRDADRVDAGPEPRQEPQPASRRPSASLARRRRAKISSIAHWRSACPARRVSLWHENEIKKRTPGQGPLFLGSNGGSNQRVAQVTGVGFGADEQQDEDR